MEWRLLTLFGLHLLVHAPLLYLPSNIVKMLTSIYILVGIYVLLCPVASFFSKFYSCTVLTMKMFMIPG